MFRNNLKFTKIKSCRLEFEYLGNYYSPVEILHSNHFITFLKNLSKIEEKKITDNNKVYDTPYFLFECENSKIQNLVHKTSNSILGRNKAEKPGFLKDYLLKNSSKIELLKTKFPQLIEDKTDYLIVPSFGYNNVFDEDIYENLITGKAPLNVISEIEFLYISKDDKYPTKNNEYILERIKKYLKMFVTDFKEPNLLSNVYMENNLPLYITFNYFDLDEDRRYVKFTDLERYVPLHLYNTTQMGGDKNILEKLVDESKKESPDIQMISYNYVSNRIHTYCSKFHLIKFDNKYYEISYKSITADAYGKDWVFPKIYKEAFAKALSINKNSSEFYCKLPSKFEIFIRETTSKLYLNVYLYTETPEDYKKRIGCIKDCRTDTSVVLHLLWKNEFRKLVEKYEKIYKISRADCIDRLRNTLLDIGNTKLELYVDTEFDNFKKFTDKMLENPVLACYIVDNFSYTDNFIISYKNASSLANVYYFLICLFGKEKLDPHAFEEEWKKIAPEINKNIRTDIDISKYSIELKKNNYDVNSLKKDFYSNNYKWHILKLIWYLPKNLFVTNYDILVDSLDNLNKLFYSKFTEYTSKPLAKSTLTYYYDFFTEFSRDFDYKKGDKIIDYSEFSNFDSVFKDDTFKHNIRYITKSNWEEINSLSKSSDFVVFHYPNQEPFNIIHFHVMPESTTTTADYSTHRAINRDIARRYHESTWGPSMVWFKNKYIDYSIANIPINVPVWNYDVSKSEDENKQALTTTLNKNYIPYLCLDSNKIPEGIIEQKIEHIIQKYGNLSPS